MKNEAAAACFFNRPGLSARVGDVPICDGWLSQPTRTLLVVVVADTGKGAAWGFTVRGG